MAVRTLGGPGQTHARLVPRISRVQDFLVVCLRNLVPRTFSLKRPWKRGCCLRRLSERGTTTLSTPNTPRLINCDLLFGPFLYFNEKTNLVSILLLRSLFLMPIVQMLNFKTFCSRYLVQERSFLPLRPDKQFSLIEKKTILFWARINASQSNL